MQVVDHAGARLSTRLAFLVAGFGISCWAPLVPLAKARLRVDDAALGLLLLCIGAGSVAAMIATGPLSARHGSRPIIVASGLALCVILPLLAIVSTPPALGIALLLFGGALGSLDVAMNVHAVEVERLSGRPLMSGFHALFSIGGFAGSGLMTLFLSLKIGAPTGAVIAGLAMFAAMLTAWPRLLTAGGADEGALFVRPRGIVLLLAMLAAVMFLAEGAVLDWSAVLVTREGLVGPSQSGVAYILFSLAMTSGRLMGDRLTARLGDFRTIAGGGLMAVAGFVVVLAVPFAPAALSGFLLIGFGAANIVPLLFRLGGAQKIMPPALAIGAITTLGYAGILVGPAGIGFLAKMMGLHAAFWMLALLLLLVPLSARRIVSNG